MDIVTLMARYRRVDPDTALAKINAVDAAFYRWSVSREDASIEEFVERIDTQLLANVLGGASTDMHYTERYSMLAQYGFRFDPLWAAVVNGIVLSLNFQTRIHDSGGPEAVIFDGDPVVMRVAMLDSNVVNAVHLQRPTTDLFDDERWPSLPELRHREEAIMRSTLSNLPMAIGDRQIGCVVLDLSDSDRVTPDRVDWIEPVAHRIGKHTIFVATGSNGTISDIATRLHSEHPDAVIYIRAYWSGNSGAGTRAIIVARGFDRLPNAIFEERRRTACRFVAPEVLASRPDGRVAIVDYHVDAQGSPLEWVRPKRPFAVVASAPPPAEVRSRISDANCLQHIAIRLRDGVLISHNDRDRAAPTFLSATDGTPRGMEIVDGDFGDLRENHRGTSTYRNGFSADGIRHGFVVDQPLITIDGPAMPLFFTPTLHLWHSHFMMQCLPRIRILESLARDAKLIVPHDLRRKQREMLAILGFGEDRQVAIPRSCIVRASELIVPKPWPLVFSEFTIEVYDRIAHALGVSTGIPHRRTLISREQRTSWRNFVNYPAIRQMLEDDYGFETIRPEVMTLKEEVETFRSTSILAGAEGAGMYGACFADAGSHCITVGDEDYMMPTLGTLARLRGFEIAYVIGDSVRADADLQRRRSHGHADFLVDPALVREVLARIQ